MRATSAASRGAEAGAHEAVLGKALDRHLLKRILTYVWPYKGLMLVALLVLPLAAAFELAQPYLLKKAIDEHIAVGKLQGLDQLGLLYLLMLVGQYGFLFLQTYLMQMVGQRAMADLRDQLYRHVLGLCQSFFETTPVGRLMTRMTSDIESLTELFASGLVSLISDSIKLTLILITIFAIDARLALFSLASAPVLLGIAWAFRRLVREAFREIRTRLARLNGFLQEHLSGIRIVQAFAQERLAAQRFDELNHAYRQASARAIFADAALYAIVEAVGSFALAGLLWHGGGRIFAGTLSFGVLVAFVEYLQKFFAPIRDLSTKYTVLQQAMAAAERIFELLDTHTPDAPVSTAPPAPEPKDAPVIEFRNLSFGYRPGQPVLTNINLKVKRGQTVAIVGPSGSGKSTLIKLLARLYAPSQGQILLDGVSLVHIPSQAVRRRIVTIGQEPYLFSGTLEQAIGLGDVAADKVQAAVDLAGAHAVVARRPEGLRAPVTARGANFSAGERQLLALARALCRAPEVLVLDEATANVDPESERLIEVGTTQLMQGRTSIVIAHRLSTILNADHIVVLEAGRVVEQGGLQELLAVQGLFSRFYQLQILGPGSPSGSRANQAPLLAAAPTSGLPS